MYMLIYLSKERGTDKREMKRTRFLATEDKEAIDCATKFLTEKRASNPNHMFTAIELMRVEPISISSLSKDAL